MGLTGLLALLLDMVLFARLRAKGQAIIVVMASFGASMALRSLLEFLFTSRPTYFSRAIQIAMPVGFGIRITPDQIVLLLVTAAPGFRRAPVDHADADRPLHAGA